MASKGDNDNAPRFFNTPFQLDYLTKPTGLLDLGIDIGKVNVAQKVKSTDQIIVIAYPSFNVNGKALCLPIEVIDIPPAKSQ